MNKELKATLFLTLTAIIWGFAFVAQRVGAEYVESFTYNGVRYFLGAISLIPVILFFEKEPMNGRKITKTAVASLLTGTVLFCASTLQQQGIVIGQSAGKAGFITGLYIVLVPVFRIFFGKKANLTTWIGVVFSCVGLYLLSVAGSEKINFGDVIVFISAFFWAAHILLIDKFVENISPLKYSFGQFLVCAILSIVSAFIFEQPTMENIFAARVPILYGGVMSVGIAYTFQVLGQKDLNPEFASIICSTEAVFSAIGGALILHETMTSRGYLGCILIFVGILFAQIKKKK